MVAVIAALELAANRTRINSDRQLMRQAIREIRERQMSEATWEEKFRFMQSENDRLLPAYMEAKAENDRLRAQLAAAEADKLAAVRRAIERAACCALTWGAQARICALPADEIANPPEQSK